MLPAILPRVNSTNCGSDQKRRRLKRFILSRVSRRNFFAYHGKDSQCRSTEAWFNWKLLSSSFFLYGWVRASDRTVLDLVLLLAMVRAMLLSERDWWWAFYVERKSHRRRMGHKDDNIVRLQNAECFWDREGYYVQFVQKKDSQLLVFTKQRWSESYGMTMEWELQMDSSFDIIM